MSIDPKLLVVKPVGELPTVANPTTGEILYYDGSGDLKKTSVQYFIQLLTGVAKPISPSDTGPFTANTWWRPTTLSVSPGTNYPNAGNLKAIEGYDTWFFYNGTSWIKMENKLPGNSAKTIFDNSDNVYPSTMKATYDYSDELVKRALGDTESTYAKYGWDLNNVSSTSSTFLSCNLSPVLVAGKIASVTIKALSTGTIEIYKINAGTTPAVGNAITRTLLTTASLIVGTNIIPLNINAIVGDMIAIKNLSATIGYTDGGAHKYFDASGSSIPNLNLGYVAYYFEMADTGIIEHPLDNLKDIVKIPNSDFNKILNGSNSSIHSRITLEGQSNALGVAAASGLTAAPYNKINIDWNSPFERVFIWNPKTNQYENLQIGVNNMSSWDSFYTIGAPTPFSTFGPEVGIALAWIQNHQFGNLYIDKNVGDGKPISYFQKGTAYYSEKLSRKSKADIWLKDRGINVSDIGFIWVQGESDMSQTKSYYKAQLTTLINDRISDGFIDSTSRLIITQIPSISANYGAGVADAKTEYVSENKIAVLLSYDSSFNSDNIHLNTTGQINIGIKSSNNILFVKDKTFNDIAKEPIDLVNNAFEQVGGPAGLFSYGVNANFTNISTSVNNVVANNIVANAGKLTKITINVPAGRSGIGFVILQKISNTKYKSIKYFEKIVTPNAVNVLNLDYDVPANCTVGMVFNGLPSGYNTTGGNGFLEFLNYDLATEGNERNYNSIQPGYLPYTFEITGTGITLEEGVQLLKDVKSGENGYPVSSKTFNVMSYGAKGDGVTDDRISIQDTINACFNAGGGKVYFPTPSQFYWLGTELTTSSQVTGDIVANIDKAQLIIPANTNTTKLITIEFVGEYKVNMADEAIQSVGRSSKGFIKSGLIKTGSGSNYDGSAIFGTAYPTNNLWNGKNYIHVHIENLIIRSESIQVGVDIDNFVHGINFERLTQFTFNYLKVEKSSIIFNSVEPTKSIGIMMPTVNNKAQLGEGSAFVAGWYIGVQQGEHFNSHRLILLGCVHGLGWPMSSQNNTYHSASIMHLNAECCRNIFLIQGGGKHVLNVFNGDVEHHNETAKWYNYQTDIVKQGTSNGSVNIFNYQVVKSAIGNSDEFITVGNPTYKIFSGVGSN